MGMRNTFRKKFGPLVINFNRFFQPSSVSLHLFGVTYRLWSQTTTRGVSSVDLPGPYSYRPGLARKKQG